MDQHSRAALPSSAVATVEAFRAVREQRQSLDVEELVLTAHFADLHAEVQGGGHVLPGQERLVEFGGPGTPRVAEFCTLELGAALRMRDVAVKSLISDALDLRHRLPRVWALVLDGRVPVWTARRVASATRELDAHRAGLVDMDLARQIVGMAHKRVETLVDGLVLAQLPFEESEARRQQALDARGVWIGQGADGICQVDAVVDAPDGMRLEAAVTKLSQVLAAGGVGGGQDARRAQALGLLASPARALNLVQADLLDQLPVAPAGGPLDRLGERDGASGPLDGRGDRDEVAGPLDKLGERDEMAEPVEAPLAQILAEARMIDLPPLTPSQLAALDPTAELVIHLSDETLAAGEGIARAPGLKPLLAQWLDQMFAGHRITVRPIIDANRQVPSDSSECPGTMREAVEHRNPYEVFPWSTRSSKGLDLDHTVPWEPGGRAQSVDVPDQPTRPDNLGPLTRKVHRAKTHAGWQLHQSLPGYFLFESPLGYRYLVTPSTWGGQTLPGTPEAHQMHQVLHPRGGARRGLTRLGSPRVRDGAPRVGDGVRAGEAGGGGHPAIPSRHGVIACAVPRWWVSA